MDKFNYFLYLKNKYTTILQNLNEICNSYEEIIENDQQMEPYLNDTELLNNQDMTELNLYKNQIQNTKKMIDNINLLIQYNCCHNYISDLIDISPDTSQYITYCTICEKTVL